MIIPIFSRVVASLALAALVGLASRVPLTASAAGEADALKTTLTPLGAERAASADGLIPAWTGGFSGTLPNRQPNGRITDPFSADKPVVTITPQNMDQYAARLSDGAKAMLRKYPDFKIVVYPTRRTALAPQRVYDATYANAAHGEVKEFAASGVSGGVPFPIPKTGIEAMYNHLLWWRGISWMLHTSAWEVDPTGRRTLASELVGPQQMPYYFSDASPSTFSGDYWLIRIGAIAPPLRAGEETVVRNNLDPDRSQAWTYLIGQRRSRKVPNACCDTPTDLTAGVMTYDENYLFFGRLDRYDWKLLGKQEIYIPYNDNGAEEATLDQIFTPHFLNPDRVRWELHRVWVVDATLRPGQRHTAPHARFYLDEDTWVAVLADRWDAKGQLWKVGWQLPIVDPDVPATTPASFGDYDLISGSWFANGMMNDEAHPYAQTARWPDSTFTPEAMSAESVR